MVPNISCVTVQKRGEKNRTRSPSWCDTDNRPAQERCAEEGVLSFEKHPKRGVGKKEGKRRARTKKDVAVGKCNLREIAGLEKKKKKKTLGKAC